MSKTLIDGVNAIRAEIASVSAEIEWVQDSMLPPDEIKAGVSASCKALSQAHDFPLGRLASPGAGMLELAEMLTAQATALNFGAGEGRHTSVSVALGGILAALFGDDLVKRLHKKVDDLDYVPGPPSRDRPEALKKLRATLHGLEAREEAMICQAEEIGLLIPRRSDADPAVILGYDPNGQTPDIGPRRASAAIVPRAASS